MAVNGSAQTAQQRRILGCLDPGFCLTGTLLLYGTVFFLFAAGLEPFVRAHQLRPGSDLTTQNDSGICKSVDIRNTLETFQRLKGCRVIEGFVQILLFDNVNETQINQISFPDLTEITDYLLLYRVNGLRSIGQLFPNLTVIRGQNLFFTYAFVIFEMSSLQEIGLYSLTDITHGMIRIDKNPSLCFVDSIDWDRIAHEKDGHFIKSSKPENECPICPGGEKDEDGLGNPLKIACPKAPKTDSTQGDRFLCWNMQHCQKICPDRCKSCNSKGECCHELCIGGCADHDTHECKVCQNFTMVLGNQSQCMFRCPKDYYEYLGRRCVTKSECISTRRPINLQMTEDIEFPFKIFQDSCLLSCPTNYMSDHKNHICKPCAGRCKKECPGVNIDSVALARTLRGCTHITGSLEIQIRGGRNVTNELEENLNMIEEINGYLKVVRSFSLISLNFLKSLRRIRGQSLESQKYVFVVLDNQNLQNLWDWDNNRTIRIDNGTLFFHFNPKLCLQKIKLLQQKANLPNFTELEVASNSNGDKIACDVKNLNVRVADTYIKGVLLEWDQFRMDDQRRLLAYIVYFIEAPYQNVTLYDGRDACGGDGWRVDDVAIPDEIGSKIAHPLTSLKPYTQYAFYVKTYTIASEKTGAQSNISYFRTKPSMPSQPLGLLVTSNSSNSLSISWQPPSSPNGEIDHYLVSVKINSNEHIDSRDRNYCKDAPVSPKTEVTTPVTPPVTVSRQPPKSNETCPCDDNKKAKASINEAEEYSRIKFEDALQNTVYVKKKDIESRRKREIPNDTTENDLILNNKTNNDKHLIFKVNGTSTYISNLHHYTSYDIYVQACRKPEVNDTEQNCSSTSISTARTEKKGGADNISKVQITNQSLDTVTFSWDHPQDPNGMIFTVSIEYKRVDLENSKPFQECITHKNIKNGTMFYTISQLIPGNYSLRVWATSSAGNGAYSPYVYFYIETPSSNALLITISVIFVTIFASMAAAWLVYKKQKERDIRLIPSVNPEYVSTVYVPDDWEVPRKKIDLIKELGQGSFGMVYEGLASDIKGKAKVRCAVKTVNEHATNRERLEFLNEASVMKAFDTAHVVRLLGVVSQGQPTLVIMELMANGDLKSYLRSHRPDAETYDPLAGKHPPTLKQILRMAIEIADGMAYLSAKKFVHRDLAARNCMVSEDLTVKIGDFGMTRDIYETDYYRKGSKGLLPVRWMAPESLKDGVFSSSSDVWSYGVVLWEMATLASQPYQGLSNDQVLRYVIDGGVMEMPENCPEKLYDLMRECWKHKPTARPTFLKLCSYLLEDASPAFAQVSFYHSAAGIEARSSRRTPSPSQDDQTTPLRRAVDYSASDSQDSDGELGIDTNTTHIQFPSISEGQEGVTTMANGYVSGCPTNGAATTQC